ncbi:MAG: hypothetical protein ABI605_04510 [Rhizobacter sp.]
MINVIAMAALGFALAGCATQYGSVGFAGGHTNKAGPGKLQKVEFHGNGFITSDTVQQFALYRCAELAQQSGKPHFMIYESLYTAALDRPAKLPRVGTLGNKPSASAFMLLLDQPRYGSQATQSVLTELDSVVHPKPATTK